MIYPKALSVHTQRARRLVKKLKQGYRQRLGFEVLEDRRVLAVDVRQLLDINAQRPTDPARPADFVDVGGVVFFTAQTVASGAELWKSVGTDDGTVMVSDIVAGIGSPAPRYLTNVSGTLYFTADDGVNGRELWKSDGTAAGTVMVKNILAGSGSNPRYLTNVGGTLYFTATTSTSGRELMRSDGTAAGTRIVRDIRAGSSSSNPDRLTNVGGTLYFRANDGTNGYELWKSDGNAAGTKMVKNISAAGGSSDPSDLTNVQGRLFFQANDGINGKELWKSDGTATGTVLVKNIALGNNGANLSSLASVNGTLYFIANDGNSGNELWSSNGTAAGTMMVKDTVAGGGSGGGYQLTNVDGVLYFMGVGTGSGPGLWMSDGTSDGTLKLMDFGRGGILVDIPIELENVNGVLFFTAYDGQGKKLWKSDGTAAGTVIVKNDLKNNAGESPFGLTNVNGALFFQGNVGASRNEVWKSDGTYSGTVMVKDIMGTSGAYPSYLTSVGGTIFFQADNGVNGKELWKSDGTSAGTVLVKDIVPGIGTPFPRILTNGRASFWNFADVNGILYFTAFTSVGMELWRSDGTTTGTSLVTDIHPNSGSFPGDFTNVGGTLYFTANDGSNGVELWKSDGTAAGTLMVKDIFPGGRLSYPNSSFPTNLVNVNGTLYFTALSSSGYELWKSDGTEAGTAIVKDIIAGPASAAPLYITNVNGAVYFVPGNAQNGRELWKTDGTESNTVMVKDIVTGSGSANVRKLTAVGSMLYFTAITSATGNELWKSDGTAAGTVLVKDIFAGSGSASPHDLINVGGMLYFVANDGTNGDELWKSDGTNIGTVRVADIRAGVASGAPANLSLLNGSLYFIANDGVHGTEVWTSDGTEAGTVIAFDVVSGNSVNKVRQLTIADQTLFFTATSAFGGDELFAIQPAGPTNLTLHGNAVAENLPIGTVVGSLQATGLNPNDQFTYQLVSGPSDSGNSMFSISGAQLKTAVSFDFETKLSYSIRVRVSNQVGRFAESNLLVSVLNANDAPALNPFAIQIAPRINEDNQTDFGTAVDDLVKNSLSDVDPSALKGIAVAELTGTATGQWQYSLNAGTNWTRIVSSSRSSATLLPSDGTNSRLRYVPNRDFNGQAAFTFFGWDRTLGVTGGTANLSTAGSTGGSTAFSVDRKTITTTIEPVNDAPVLNVTGNPTLPTITEDSMPGLGSSVTTLIGSVVTDIDSNSKKGIAIVRVTGASLGVWQYTLDNGTAWTNLDSVSLLSALLLPSTGIGTRVRFLPNANANGSVTLMYLAWDQTSGTIGGRADLSMLTSRGGTTAFSKDIEIASLTITSVNDAPVLDISRTVMLGQFASTTPTWPSFSVAALVTLYSRDSDTGALKGIAITNLATTSSGAWRYSIDSGTNWTSIGATTSSNALLLPSTALVQFIPSRFGAQTPSFNYLSWDQTSGQIASRVNLSSLTSRGGSKAFSIAEGIAMVDVTAE